EAVLNPVVHHLRVVAGTHGAGVHEPLVPRTVGSQRVEDRHQPVDVLLGAAGHQPVAHVQAPDPAGDPDIDVTDAALGELGRVLRVVDEVRVAALDHQVTGGQQGAEL